MIRWTVPKALIAGVGVLIVTAVALTSEVLPSYYFRDWVRFISPGLAGFTAAYLAPRWKVMAGISIAILGPIIGALWYVVYHYLYEATDPYHYLHGLWGYFVMHFLLFIYPTVVGALLGYFLSRIRSIQKKSVFQR